MFVRNYKFLVQPMQRFSSRIFQRSVPSLVWRGEFDRPPTEIVSARGFWPKGGNRSLIAHAKHHNEDSFYVSFTTDLHVAAAYSCHQSAELGAIYLLNTPALFIDIMGLPQEFMFKCKKNMAIGEMEKEIASAMSVVPLKDIACWISFEHGPNQRAIKQKFNQNEQYQKRNWAVQVFSADDKEQEKIEDLMYKQNTLDHSKRNLTYVEASELGDELEDHFSHVSSKGNSFFIFSKTEKEFSRKQAICTSLQEYETSMKEELGSDQLIKFHLLGNIEQQKNMFSANETSKEKAMAEEAQEFLKSISKSND